MKALLLPICLVACLGLCLGQSPKTVKPDLSGTWEFDAAGGNFKIKITHHDPELIIRRNVTIDGLPQERDLTYYTDGRGERNPTTTWTTFNPGSDPFRPSETRSKTIWSKDKVVTRAFGRSYYGATMVEFELIDEFQLSSDGKTLTNTRRAVPRGVSPNTSFGSQNLFKIVYKLISK